MKRTMRTRRGVSGLGSRMATVALSFTSAAGRVLVANFIAQPALTVPASALGAPAFAWPAAADGWVLQACDDLGAGNWTDSTLPVEIVGSQKQVALPPSAGGVFFRLVYP